MRSEHQSENRHVAKLQIQNPNKARCADRVVAVLEARRFRAQALLTKQLAGLSPGARVERAEIRRQMARIREARRDLARYQTPE